MSYVMKTFSGNMTIAYTEAVAWIYQLIVYYLRLRKNEEVSAVWQLLMAVDSASAGDDE